MTKKNRWRINWTSDKIMSTSALFISVILLIALLYQSYLAREENRLNQRQQSANVLPYLSQLYSEYDDKFKSVFESKIIDFEIIYENVYGDRWKISSLENVPIQIIPE